MPIQLHQFKYFIILYYHTKFLFNIVNSFKVINRRRHPPPSPTPRLPQKAQAEKGNTIMCKLSVTSR